MKKIFLAILICCICVLSVFASNEENVMIQTSQEEQYDYYSPVEVSKEAGSVKKNEERDPADRTILSIIALVIIGSLITILVCLVIAIVNFVSFIVQFIKVWRE